MKKYPSIPRLGKKKTNGILSGDVTVLEKLDGANFRFTHGKNVDGVSPERLVFGSKNVIYKNEKDTDSNFEHAIEFVRDRVTPEHFTEEVERGEDELTIFGEAMHPHTLDYDWDDVPSVLIFDVWSDEEGWLPWTDIEAVSSRLDIDTVPVVRRRGEYQSVDDLPLDFDSHYGVDVPEGIVLRGNPGGKLIRAKYRTEEFLDRHGTDHPSPDDALSSDDSVALAYELLGKEPWVKKWIHKYEDSDREIHMGVMENLWRDVFDDIIDEEYETIFLGNYDINTKTFRSTIASHTADVLQEYLRRPDESVLNEAQ